MSKRKDIKHLLASVDEMDAALVDAFQLVQKDIQRSEREITQLKKTVKMLVSDRNRNTKVGPVTGKTYMTQTGKINALAKFLGIEFKAVPAKKINATIDVVKTKKGKK